jgi:hypothetical protein
MKKILLFFMILCLLGSCKKAIQNAQEDLVIQAMTNGQWAITSFTHNGVNITSDFTGYKFQYYSNKTVDAILNGVVDKTGSWDGNASAMTTYANFPTAGNPLLLINGSWHIENNSWTFVVASQTIGAETKTMRLDKL